MESSVSGRDERTANGLLRAAPAWHDAHRGAVVGVLAMRGVANPGSDPGLAAVADELERELRERFGGMERAALREIDPLPAYAAYFKRFGQRYHVAMQLESVAQKGKAIPRVAALVEAMFVAELRHRVLTAGHDLDAVRGPVRLDVGTAAERYATPGGGEATVKAGDMYTADEHGVLSAVVTGPAAAARIGPGTTAALFVAYAPPGVAAAAIEAHLEEIEANVRLVGPGCETIERSTVVAGG